MEMTGAESNNNSINGEHGMNRIENEATVEQRKNDLWEKAQKSELIERLKAGESLQDIMDSFLSQVKNVFTKLKRIACSDGRVFPVNGDAKLGIAGEGILLDEDALTCFINECIRQGVEGVDSHDDCGAAGAAFKEDAKGEATADDLGKTFAKKLSDRAAIDYGHIALKDMTGEIHNERVLCLDGTGMFNPGALLEGNKMPGHFLCSGCGFGLGAEYIKKEVPILTGIALGHGFEGRLDEKDNKFIIIISAKDNEQLAEMTEVTEKAVEKYGDRVEVKGFVHNIEA
jgi:hypothetical protein